MEGPTPLSTEKHKLESVNCIKEGDLKLGGCRDRGVELGEGCGGIAV